MRRFGLLSLILGPLLGGCPLVDLGDQPPVPGDCRPDRVQFEATVWPNAIALPGPDSCVASDCHAKATGRSAFRVIENPTTPADWDENYEVTIRFTNCGTPSASTLITKPAEIGNPHAGGDIWTIGSGEALIVEQWIETSP